MGRARFGAGAAKPVSASAAHAAPTSGRGVSRVLWVTLLGLALAPLAPSPPAAAASPTRRQVLMLNSYNSTYTWTASVVDGARSVFDTMDDVELSTEFLDSKKIFTTEYAALLAEVYARKYVGVHLDLIVSSDDDALDFLKTYRDRLFPGVPVVFCGVNSFKDQRIAGFTNVTGVNEETDYDKSFEWIARLRPATRQLVFVVDDSATSASAIRQIEAVAPRWRPRFALSFISDVTIAELEGKLRALPPDALVFWQMFMHDRNGVSLSIAESHRRVVNASPVPVFGFTGVSVNVGAAGGYAVSGFAQGELAARMGARILAGTPADRIPIVRHSPNVYMLDYPSFKRWHLDADHPPPGAIVTNRPFSFYERYRSYVWAVFGGMAAESLIILILIGAIRRLTRKSRARLREGNVELGRAHRNLQDVLDSMKEGLLVCDRAGIVGPIRSRAVMEWFGAPQVGARVWDFLFEDSAPEGLVFRVAFEQIAEDVLPFELSADQLPRTIVRGDKTYGVTCQQVMRDGAFAEVVFTIVDVTRELEQASVERRIREQTTLVGHLLSDREGLRVLIDGTNQLLAKLGQASDPGERMRLLHTLKGNTATYGLESFAARCHDLEALIAQGAKDAVTTGIDALTREWHAAVSGLAGFVTGDEAAGVRLAPPDYQDLLARLERRDDPTDTLLVVRQWGRPLMSQVLGVHVRTVRQVARRLGKEIETRVLDHGLRLPSDELRPFLNVLGHVVRNASDHGIESPDEREHAGKPRAGLITIESRQDGPELVIAIEDDGRGIDWDAVREHAQRRSLLAADRDDLIEALFADGLSTRGVTTEISGRGVGLGAVRAVCRELGGTIRIASQAGRGTRIEFRFASPAVTTTTKGRTTGPAIHAP